jgi:chromosomal replication initiator protein
MATTVDFSWNVFLDAIRTRFPELYRTWFEDLPPAKLDAGQLLVVVHDPMKLRFLRDTCTAAFSQTAMTLTGHLIAVRFAGPTDEQRTTLRSSLPSTLSQTPLSPDYTFEQFVVGPSNRLAHAAAQAICTHPGSLYNPLFIHGSSGLGKTHLLQATCSELLARNPTARMTYISCEVFVNDFVRAIEAGRVTEFRSHARQADALVVDDVQFLANRESSQEELFHTFNVLYQGRKQIILSADSPPSQIPTLEDRLVSRFSWGLVTQIDPPNRETRQAILHKKACLRGWEIPDDLLDYLASSLECNVRLLEGALTKLISDTQIGGKPMTLDTAREVLAHFNSRPARQLQVSDILEAVSNHFSIRVPDLIGRKRSRSISHPRQVAMYLARKLTPLSLEEIGLHFGGRDHSTVLHAERVIETARVKHKPAAETLAELTSQLLGRR